MRNPFQPIANPSAPGLSSCPYNNAAAGGGGLGVGGGAEF